MQNVFDYFKSFLQNIYTNAEELGIDINNRAMFKFFDKYFQPQNYQKLDYKTIINGDDDDKRKLTINNGQLTMKENKKDKDSKNSKNNKDNKQNSNGTTNTSPDDDIYDPSSRQNTLASLTVLKQSEYLDLVGEELNKVIDDSVRADLEQRKNLLDSLEELRKKELQQEFVGEDDALNERLSVEFYEREAKLMEEVVEQVENERAKQLITDKLNTDKQKQAYQQQLIDAGYTIDEITAEMDGRVDELYDNYIDNLETIRKTQKQKENIQKLERLEKETENETINIKDKLDGKQDERHRRQEETDKEITKNMTLDETIAYYNNKRNEAIAKYGGQPSITATTPNATTQGTPIPTPAPTTQSRPQEQIDKAEAQAKAELTEFLNQRTKEYIEEYNKKVDERGERSTPQRRQASKDIYDFLNKIFNKEIMEESEYATSILNAKNKEREDIRKEMTESGITPDKDMQDYKSVRQMLDEYEAGEKAVGHFKYDKELKKDREGALPMSSYKLTREEYDSIVNFRKNYIKQAFKNLSNELNKTKEQVENLIDDKQQRNERLTNLVKKVKIAEDKIAQYEVYKDMLGKAENFQEMENLLQMVNDTEARAKIRGQLYKAHFKLPTIKNNIWKEIDKQQKASYQASIDNILAGAYTITKKKGKEYGNVLYEDCGLF
jgi:hypothetical protein